MGRFFFRGGKGKGKLTAGHSREQEYPLFYIRFVRHTFFFYQQRVYATFGNGAGIFSYGLGGFWDRGVTTVYDHTFWGEKEREKGNL